MARHNSKGPTFKQKMFAREYVKNGGHGVNAALATYDADYLTAKAMASQNLQKKEVQEEIALILDRSGLTLDATVNKLKDSIDIGMKSDKASLADSIRAIDMVLKLYKAYPDKITKHFRAEVRKTEVVKKDVTEIAKEARSNNEKTNKLLDDLGI